MFEDIKIQIEKVKELSLEMARLSQERIQANYKERKKLLSRQLVIVKTVEEEEHAKR